MLEESRYLTFLDEKLNYTVHFLEGQKLIHDLAIIHNFEKAPQGFGFFRDSILSLQTIISFLKPGENLGVYIDSELPYFRLKIEMNATGLMRTLLIPEFFNENPEFITGLCRVTKVVTYNNRPYTSSIQLNAMPFKSIMNEVMHVTYQIQSEVYVSDEADQSILVTRLPNPNVDQVSDQKRVSPSEYIAQFKSKFDAIFKQGLNDHKEIQKQLEAMGLTYLHSKEIKFKCSCSRDRMVLGVKGLSTKDELFSKGEKFIETKCDYCGTYYQLTKEEILKD